MGLSIDDFEDLATEHLVPLFPGCSSKWDPAPKQHFQEVAVYPGGHTLALRLDRNWQKRLALSRPLPFVANDRAVVESFMAAVKATESAAQQPYWSAVRSEVGSRVVARALDIRREQTITNALGVLLQWSQRTYEGHEITAGFVLDPAANANAVDRSLREYARQAFAPVLSNGVDTLLELDNEGRVSGLRVVPSGRGDAPARFAAVAAYCTGERIGLCLSRRGEILTFAEEALRFARRRGAWRLFDRTAAIVHWIGSANNLSWGLREAVYETCLDCSFSRTGACIGVVDKFARKKTDKVLSTKDAITSNRAKPRVVRGIVGGRKWQDLDRTVRAELASLDGAIVLSHTGEVLGAGAILRVPGGSTGGGRTAAARALARLGFAAKVSSDGGVQVFRGSQRAEVYLGF